MAISLFEPRTMGRMLKERKGPRTFLRDTFFATRQPYDTEHIDFDVETQVRRMAPFSNPKLAGKVMGDTGYTTKSFTPPMVNPKKVTTAEHLQNRMPGESVYGGLSPDERAAMKLGADLADLDDMISRREEWMCAQVLLTGLLPIVGDGVNVTLDFGRPAACAIGTLAAAARWSAGTADIPKNFRDWRRVVVKQCGLAPNVAVLGTLAADALLSNTALAAALDTRRADMGIIAPEILDTPGVTYLGRLAGTGMDLFSYDEWYLDDTGTEQPMVSEKLVMVGSSQARTELAYGACAVTMDEKITLVSGERVPESWTEREPPVRYVKVSSRPLPIPIQIGAFAVAQVLA